jgi:hypothetical protein
MIRDPMYFRGLRAYLPKTSGCVVENAFRNGEMLACRSRGGSVSGGQWSRLWNGHHISLNAVLDVQLTSLAHEALTRYYINQIVTVIHHLFFQAMTARNYKVRCRVCLLGSRLDYWQTQQEDSDTPGNQSRQGSVTCSIDFEFGIIYAAGVVIVTGQFDASAETCICFVRHLSYIKRTRIRQAISPGRVALLAA